MNAPTPPARPAPAPNAALEAALMAVENAIDALGQAMTAHDIARIETAGHELQECLRAGMGAFAQLARRGRVPAALRHRLALANARIGAQREALFRATAGVDQALEILFPRPIAQASVYSASGAAARGPGQVLAAS